MKVESVSVFKLKNGSDIIGEVEQNTPSLFEIKNPLLFKVTPQKTGNQVQIDPWCWFQKPDAKISLAADAVLAHYEPEEKFARDYEGLVQQMQAQRAGIHLPNGANGPRVVK